MGRWSPRRQRRPGREAGGRPALRFAVVPGGAPADPEGSTAPLRREEAEDGLGPTELRPPDGPESPGRRAGLRGGPGRPIARGRSRCRLGAHPRGGPQDPARPGRHLRPGGRTRGDPRPRAAGGPCPARAAGGLLRSVAPGGECAGRNQPAVGFRCRGLPAAAPRDRGHRLQRRGSHRPLPVSMEAPDHSGAPRFARARTRSPGPRGGPGAGCMGGDPGSKRLRAACTSRGRGRREEQGLG